MVIKRYTYNPLSKYQYKHRNYNILMKKSNHTENLLHLSNWLPFRMYIENLCFNQQLIHIKKHTTIISYDIP